MIIQDKYYVLKTKSTPIKFYNNDENNWTVDDFRNAIKFKNKTTLKYYIESENENNRLKGKYGNDYDLFDTYEPMLVKVTYEF